MIYIPTLNITHPAFYWMHWQHIMELAATLYQGVFRGRLNFWWSNLGPQSSHTVLGNT